MSNELNQKELKTLVKSKIIKNSKKIREKHSNISELVNKTPKTLEVKNIYDLSEQHANLYLMVVRNHAKQPKTRYFLAISLASQSSDLVVNLARDIVKKDDDVRLIQFSIHPKSMRVSLLALKELTSIENYSHSIDLLQDLRRNFRQKLTKFANQGENE